MCHCVLSWMFDVHQFQARKAPHDMYDFLMSTQIYVPHHVSCFAVQLLTPDTTQVMSIGSVSVQRRT